MRVVIEDMSDDKLSCKRWEFMMHTFPHMCLVGYAENIRESTRKKKWGGLRWDGYYNGRNNSIAKPVSIPDDVIIRAQSEYLGMIKGGSLFIGAGMNEKDKINKPWRAVA